MQPRQLPTAGEVIGFGVSSGSRQGRWTEWTGKVTGLSWTCCCWTPGSRVLKTVAAGRSLLLTGLLPAWYTPQLLRLYQAGLALPGSAPFSLASWRVCPLFPFSILPGHLICQAHDSSGHRALISDPTPPLNPNCKNQALGGQGTKLSPVVNFNYLLVSPSLALPDETGLLVLGPAST